MDLDEIWQRDGQWVRVARGAGLLLFFRHEYHALQKFLIAECRRDFHETWQEYMNHGTHESLRSEILNFFIRYGIAFPQKKILGTHIGSFGQILGSTQKQCDTKKRSPRKSTSWHSVA